MKLMYGFSKNGILTDALTRIKNPDAIIFLSNPDQLEQHAKEIAQCFPDIPSIGAISIGYANQHTLSEGVIVYGFQDVTVAIDILDHLSTMPVRHIDRMTRALRQIEPGDADTICFDISVGNDTMLVATFNSVLENKNIPLVGGRSSGAILALNGSLYTDSCVFMFLKNNSGTIKTYRENIYVPTDKRFLATKTNPNTNQVVEIDGRPAATVYCEELGIGREEAQTQTLTNPLGRVYGNETYLVSIQDISGQTLSCYKPIYNMDVLTIMEKGDYHQIIADTLETIYDDLPNCKGIFSINCIVRYQFLENENYWPTYLNRMSDKCTHAGFVSYGEHFNRQHVNQTMCCFAFD